jgi:hypothetical protein
LDDFAGNGAEIVLSGDAVTAGGLFFAALDGVGYSDTNLITAP